MISRLQRFGRRIGQELRDALELVLLPGLAAILPWPLCYRVFRWVSRFDGLYRERWEPALVRASAAGRVGDARTWARHARIVALLDHADLYLVMTRGAGWMHRYGRRAGEWPTPGTAFIGYTFHWGAGFRALCDLAGQGQRAHPLVAPQPDASGAGPRVRGWYFRLRNRWIARTLRADTLDVGRDLRRVIGALRAGDGVIAAVDVPPLGAASERVPFLDGSIAVPRAMFRLAVERGLPAVVFLCDLDFRDGSRSVEVIALNEREDVGRLATEAFGHLSQRVAKVPEAWHFWGSYEHFDPRTAADSSAAAPVDVIVPVYADPAATRRCVESVLAARGKQPFELIVVADAPPDAEVRAYCESLASRAGVQVLFNEVNAGFVASVNRGMALHPERDVVLLNSDTEVADGWLDRLAGCARAHPDAGTLTPFSNDATICSYPWAGWRGGLPGGLGLAALDALFARVNAGRSVEVPVGVGSCLYIRRACLTQAGPFDEAAFGRGYGEECDFCLRASTLGWRHLLCADVFVFHAGGISFGADKERLAAAAQRVLHSRWPHYEERVAQFVAADPAGGLRDAIDDARIALGTEEAMRVAAERRAERTYLRGCYS